MDTRIVGPLAKLPPAERQDLENTLELSESEISAILEKRPYRYRFNYYPRITWARYSNIGFFFYAKQMICVLVDQTAQKFDVQLPQEFIDFVGYAGATPLTAFYMFAINPRKSAIEWVVEYDRDKPFCEKLYK